MERELCNPGTATALDDPADAAKTTHLVLDESERCLRGSDMAPLLGGEFELLRYLGARAPAWHSTCELCVRVYHRTDPGGRQLVWKYASTLRKKLSAAHPELLEFCRRRGYRCREHVVAEGGQERRDCRALMAASE